MVSIPEPRGCLTCIILDRRLLFQFPLRLGPNGNDKSLRLPLLTPSPSTATRFAVDPRKIP